MAIRLPLKSIGSFTATANEVGAGSTLGGIGYSVTLPQDTDNVLVKFTASVVSGGYSAVLQTTDDGGSTWYDCARTSVVTNANTQNAEWLSVSTGGVGYGTPAVQTTSSVITATIGKAASIAGNKQSGLPILSQQARVFVVITGNITDANSNTYVAQVLVNSQSATA